MTWMRETLTCTILSNSLTKSQTTTLQAPWLLMLETDYVWMRPLAAPPAESASPSRAYHYGYISAPPPPQFATAALYTQLL